MVLVRWRGFALAAALAVLSSGTGFGDEILFTDDFEADLSRWDVTDPAAVAIVDSGDPAHGHVMQLAPAHARLRALMRGSAGWRGYRVEADVLFPEDVHNYLGFVYHHRESEGRVDLGSIYLKGNDSYIRVNPRRDWNPARQLYEEYRTPLVGPDAIRIGQWHRIAAEVVGTACHFYVDDLAVPKVTFDLYEGDAGEAGFKPRVVGGAVWIDNVRVTSIAALGYQGPRLPTGIDYRPEELVRDWSVLGPLDRADEALERASDPRVRSVVIDGTTHDWRRFETDARGAVLTGRVTDFLGHRTVAYFQTVVNVPGGEEARLSFSSIDDLALWVNGRFEGYLTRDGIAWHDFGRHPDHPATAGLRLRPGVNRVLVRVRGGQYATGGFFARVEGPGR